AAAARRRSVACTSSGTSLTWMLGTASDYLASAPQGRQWRRFGATSPYGSDMIGIVRRRAPSLEDHGLFGAVGEALEVVGAEVVSNGLKGVFDPDEADSPVCVPSRRRRLPLTVIPMGPERPIDRGRSSPMLACGCSDRSCPAGSRAGRRNESRRRQG